MSLTGNAATDKVLRGRINRLDTLVVNAYEIAVKNGFEGTEKEWLESIKGEKGDPGTDIIITVSGNGDGTYSANYDVTEINAMYEENVPFSCYWYDESVMTHLAIFHPSTAFEFTAVSNESEYKVVISKKGVDCSIKKLARESSIPTRTSQLTNDSGFLTKDLVTSVNGQVGDVTVPTAVKVTVIQTEDGKYIADLHSEQLMEAYNQGRMLYCEFGTRILSLVRVSKAQMVFGCVQAGAVYQIFVGDQTATLTISPLHSGDGSGSLTITDDGNGNVTITTASGSSITDETSE